MHQKDNPKCILITTLQNSETKTDRKGEIHTF